MLSYITITLLLSDSNQKDCTKDLINIFTRFSPKLLRKSNTWKLAGKMKYVHVALCSRGLHLHISYCQSCSDAVFIIWCGHDSTAVFSRP